MIRRIPLTIVLVLGACAEVPDVAREAAVPHHDIHVKLHLDSGHLEAVDHITMTASDTVDLDVAPGLEPRRVLVDGRPVSADVGRGRWRVAVGPAARHGITIHYGGVIVSSPSGSQSGQTRRALVGPEGAYLAAGSGWFPHSGGGPLTYRVAIQVGERYRAVVPGRLAEEEAMSGAYRAVFIADRPNDGPTVFAGPYAVRERIWNGIRLRTYFHDDVADLAEEYLDLSARYLSLFRERIGPYPYDRFSVISAPLPVGAGFPGLAYMARGILRLPFIKTRSLAHEILHNWWGNGVAADYERGNWAEGLTTFMADYTLIEEAGAAKAKEMRLGWLRDYAALPPGRDRPLTDFRVREHDADQVVGYNKAAFVFRMLRDEIGADAFAAGIRLIWQRHRYETASWDDLRAGFQAASGEDLETFFAQWLDRPGAARLRLDAVEAEPDGKGYRVGVSLAQDSPDYALSVPVVIETDIGSERRRVRLETGTVTHSFRVEARPVAVAIDPDYELFRFLAPGEAPPILRDLTLDPGAITVLATGGDEQATTAARALADRLLDVPVRIVPPGAAAKAQAPLLVIGLTPEVRVFLTVAGLSAAPAAVAREGTARAWAARRDNGPAIVVVAAADAAALEAVARPLPHYRGLSFLAFDGARVTLKGTWPPGDSALRRRFD